MRSPKSSDRPSTSAPSDAATRRANLQRRGFLLTLGVGGASAVAVVAGKVAGVPEVPVAKTAEPADSKGYALNDHIRRYYQTAKV